MDGKWEHNVGSPDLLGPALVEEFPEIISCVRLFNPNWIDKWTVSKEKKYFSEKSLFFADPAIFEVFTFPLIKGNPETALRDPNSLVITETMARKYFGTEDPMGKTLTILGLFVSCLGLYGLSSYLLEQRTKEIGIRKVLGASMPKILFMVSREFLRWTVSANIAAWPIIYFAMKKWLENFAYRISIPFWAFLLSGAIVMATSLLTISYRSVKTAMSDPADSLRYE